MQAIMIFMKSRLEMLDHTERANHSEPPQVRIMCKSKIYIKKTLYYVYEN